MGENDEKDENSMPRIKCVDLRYAYSVFDEVKKVPLPNNWEATDGYGLTRELWGIIQYSPRWIIRRHKNSVPVQCLNIPPCAPAANTYSIFAGKKQTIRVLEKDQKVVSKVIDSVE